MTIRLGDLLIKHGAITCEQRDAIIAQQEQVSRPFGVLAEEMFGVAPSDVEHAWAVQYSSIADTVDPQLHIIEPDVLSSIQARQAWQFGLIPIYTKDCETVFVSCTEFLARAMRFVGWRFGGECSFAVCSHENLISGLKLHYAMGSMSDQMINRLMQRPGAA